jgi:hypothetical protein
VVHKVQDVFHLARDRRRHGQLAGQHQLDVAGGGGGVDVARQLGQAGQRALLRGLPGQGLAVNKAVISGVRRASATTSPSVPRSSRARWPVRARVAAMEAAYSGWV